MILGISYGFHDSAAALVAEGDVVAAVEEERLSRIKHDASFPGRAADVCLAIAGASVSDIEAVAFHEKPIDVLDRHMRSRLRAGPRALPALLGETPRVVHDQLAVPHQLSRWFGQRGSALPPVVFAEHHTSHAAAAFYPSPFERAAVLTVDGVGEHATTSIGVGQGSHLSVEEQLNYPHSIGLLYSAFTSYCGFRVNSGEGELMGLAPFGEPRFADRIRDNLITVDANGSVWLDQRYFAYLRGRRMTSRRFSRLFEGAPRPLGSQPTQREADLAASVQMVLEEIMLGCARRAHDITGADSLCLAGGVALNCVANGRVLREGPFSDLWVQPAAGDAGSAVGAALWTWFTMTESPRRPRETDAMKGAFLGPSFDNDEVERWLETEQVPFTAVPDADERARIVAERLGDGAIVGWFTGRMEFGPRALGHRSILADPRSPHVQRRLNSLVKERAAFRPFAPVVLLDRVGEFFDHAGDAPYMNIVATVASDQWVEGEESAPRRGAEMTLDDIVGQVRSTIPAVTHVDHSARLQTVDKDRNPALERLLTAFDAHSGCPVLLNTSFNARDEPIVCTPADALQNVPADRPGPSRARALSDRGRPVTDEERSVDLAVARRRSTPSSMVVGDLFAHARFRHSWIPALLVIAAGIAAAMVVLGQTVVPWVIYPAL